MNAATSRRPRTQVIGSIEPVRTIEDRLQGLDLRGILFIGDPHLASYAPGRRLDAYLDTSLGKLERCAQLAKERQLLPLCPGDLVDDHEDHDPVMYYRATRTLYGFNPPMVTTVGNHDKSERQLTEKSFLSLLGLTGAVDLVAQPGFWGRVLLTGVEGQTHRLVVGFTPYGFPLPTSLADALGLDATASVAEARAVAQADTVMWVTHGDFAFEGAYPGAAPLVEIPGIDLILNGHMHGLKKPVKRGTTVWYNLGNIVRMSVDMADEVPSAWAWSPFETGTMPAVTGERVPSMEQLVLPHAPGASTFSFEGKHAAPTLLLDDRDNAALEPPSLQFTEGMKQVRDDLRTGDGSRMREDMTAVMTDLNTPERARRIVEDLAQRAARALQMKDHP